MFRYDSALSSFIRKLLQLMALGFLWLLFSLPLVTIGAASISLAEYCIKLSKNEEGYLIQEFVQSFKRNFKQGIRFWIPMLVLMPLFVIDYLYYGRIAIVFGCIWMLECTYVFFIMAKFENTFWGHIRMSVILIARNLPCALLVLFIDIVLAAAIYMTSYLLIAPLMGLCFFLQAVVFEIFFDSQLRKGGIVQSE